MKNIKQSLNLLLDVFLFIGFLLAFYLDVTGVIAHQWLGMAIVGFGLIHFLLHIDWVAVSLNRFGALRSRPLLYLFLDTGIAFGFLGILATGLIISTWLNLTLVNYEQWVDFHIAFSLETILLVAVKVALHARWIGNAARALTSRPVHTISAPLPQPTGQPVNVKMMSRRDFLLVAGIAGITSAAAISSVLKNNLFPSAATQVAAADNNPVSNGNTDSATYSATSTVQSENISAQATVSPQTSATQQAQVAAQDSSSAAACVYRCPRGRHCAFPGQCRLYVDSNSNGLCDNGECL